MPRSVKISVIGAGSGVFSLGLVKDLCLNENLRECTVSFMDVNPERLEIVRGLAVRYADELGSRTRSETTLDREVALDGSDFVINTASPRSHHSQRRERELTAEHGYYYGGTNLHAPFENFDLMLAVARDNVLQSHQTQSYEQAVEALRAILQDPEHANLAARYRGFDGTGHCWQAPVLSTAGWPAAQVA